jgi:hypothetical protein
VVITGSAATYDFTEAQWVEVSARVFSRLGKAADTVIVIPGTPSLPFDGPGCVARNISPEGQSDRAACQATDRQQPVSRVVRDLGCVFHAHSATDSTGIRPLIPRAFGH